MRRGWQSTSILLVAIALLVTWPASPALAQPAPVVELLAPRIGVSDAPLSITLADAIRMTLEQNNDVAIARLDTDVARQNVLVLEGVYDPRVIPNVWIPAERQRQHLGDRRRDGRPARADRGRRRRWPDRSHTVGGGRYTVDFSGARLDTSNQFARLNPEFPSALTGTYVQPLLRGRTIDLDRRNILVARRAVDLTDAQLTQVVMDQLTLVEEAYWDLAFASGNLVVLTDALAQARGQVASNQRQVSQGTLAPIDVVEAQTQVSRFQQAVFSGQQALTEAENRLKRLMLTDRTSRVWNQPLVPADLADRTPPPHALDQALTLALDPAARAQVPRHSARAERDRSILFQEPNQAAGQRGRRLHAVGPGRRSALGHRRSTGRYQRSGRCALCASESALAAGESRTARHPRTFAQRRRPRFLRRRPGPLVQQPVRAPLPHRRRPAADGIPDPQPQRSRQPRPFGDCGHAARAPPAAARAADRRRGARCDAGGSFIGTAPRSRRQPTPLCAGTVRKRNGAASSPV